MFPRFLLALFACTLSLAAEPYQMARTSERLLKAQSGREYRLLLAWPAGEPPAEGWPVTYVLDGDDLFPLFTSILRVQAGTEKAARHNGVSPGLVVGLGYPGASQRDLDYTPAAPAGPPETFRDGRPYPAAPSGGADALLAFLEGEVKPLLAKEFRLNPQRQALLGHGYGGLFALHVLFTQPQAFQTYLASSPSAWWNNRYIRQEEQAFAARAQATPVQARLVLTVGELEQSLTEQEYAFPEGPREEHSLKVARRRMVDNTRELYWRLQKLRPHGVQVDFRVMPGESHKSVTPGALSHLLPYAFPPAAAAH